MRRHPTGLKVWRFPVEPSYMIRGGSGLRRQLLALALIACGVFTMLPAGLAEATTSVNTKAGDAPGGPPSIPVVNGAMHARVNTVNWSDLVPTEAWARTAIGYTAGTNDWMRDFPQNPDGSYPFRPNLIETRKYFARAAVKAFAPTATVNPEITFTDLPATDPFYRWVNIAVKMGWMCKTATGAFGPDDAVTMNTVHKVLVLALGMRATAQQLNALHTSDGVKFATPANFGTTLLGMRLGLRYDSSLIAQNVNPMSRMPRYQVAYSIYRAKTLPSWTVPWVAGQYAGIVLPRMGPMRLKIVQWGIRYVGYPYVWAGEWGFSSPEPAALGGQTTAGFDCSGLAWWLMRGNNVGSSWKIAPPRPYLGWALPQRVAADQASMGARLNYQELVPGDLMFFSSAGNGSIDHVDVYIGNGFSLDSSGSPGGVTIMPVDEGWYRDHFVHGRRLIPPPSGS